MIHSNRTVLLTISLLFILTSLYACVAQRDPAPSPMQKWREMAKKNRGFSPSASKRTVDLPPKKIETIAPSQKPEPPSRPLPKRKITMKMHQTDVAVLLRALARSVNVNIMINESVTGKISVSVKEAQWDQVFLSILHTHGLAYEWEGDIIRIITFEDRDRNFKNLEAEHKIRAKKREMEMQGPLETKIIPIDFADAGKLKTNVEQFLSLQMPDKPIGSVMVDSHTNALIVQAMPKDMQRIVPLIMELDRPTQQILIEAHIVETTSRTARELGVQWGGLLYDPDHNYWIAPDAMGAIQIQPGAGDSITPSAGSMMNFPANLGNATQSGTGLNLGFIAGDSEDILAIQLSALEEEGKLNILSSPSITTLDNLKAVIESGDQVPIPIVENGEVQVIYKEALLSLEVTPHVIQNNALKLDIETTKNELDFSRAVSLYPTIITKRAATNVILFDGQTTVIGGLKKNTNQTSEAGIPWARKIPILGHLFKNQGKREQMEEILIFITPHVLKTRPTPAIEPTETSQQD